jgi:hypothetical protein
MSEYIEGVGEVMTPRTFKERAANFWYHYKWHSIVSLILVFAITVCMLQFCKKENYDIHILYAGDHVVGKTLNESGEAEIQKSVSSFKKITKDYDDDGKIKVNFTNYYFLSADEQQQLGSNVDYAFLTNDKKSLESALEFSEYYLCFISPAVYEAYNEHGEIDMFISLDEYKADISESSFYAYNAIKLSDTDFYKMPGISSLPSDTLICIKTPSVLASKSDKHNECISRAKETLKIILNYTVQATN